MRLAFRRQIVGFISELLEQGLLAEATPFTVSTFPSGHSTKTIRLLMAYYSLSPKAAKLWLNQLLTALVTDFRLSGIALRKEKVNFVRSFLVGQTTRNT